MKKKGLILPIAILMAVTALLSVFLTLLIVSPGGKPGQGYLPEEEKPSTVQQEQVNYQEEQKKRKKKESVILSDLDLPSSKSSFVVSYVADAISVNGRTEGWILVGIKETGGISNPTCDVPASLGGIPVLAIGTGLPKDLGFSEWHLAEGIRRIDALAFEEAGLQHIQFPSSLEEIGDGAFLRSGLSMAAVGDLQTAPVGIVQTPGCKIGKMAFAEIKANKFAVGEGCTEIGSCAFGWDVKELWLPESIRICHAFAELQEDGSFAPLTLSKKNVTLHFAGDEAAFREIDFGCPLPDGVEIVYRSVYGA